MYEKVDSKPNTVLRSDALLVLVVVVSSVLLLPEFGRGHLDSCFGLQKIADCSHYTVHDVYVISRGLRVEAGSILLSRADRIEFNSVCEKERNKKHRKKNLDEECAKSWEWNENGGKR